jgi:hypothetical protein
LNIPNEAVSRTSESRLFHDLTVDGKKDFLNRQKQKPVFTTIPRETIMKCHESGSDIIIIGDP